MVTIIYVHLWLKRNLYKDLKTKCHSVDYMESFFMGMRKFSFKLNVCFPPAILVGRLLIAESDYLNLLEDTQSL